MSKPQVFWIRIFMGRVLEVDSLEDDSYGQGSLSKTDIQGAEAFSPLVIILHALSPKSYELP